MVVYYGMGNKIIYPSTSEKYKAKIDDEVARLIGAAYSDALYILQNSKEFILEAVEILKRDNIIRVDVLDNMIHRKHRNLLQLKNNEAIK